MTRMEKLEREIQKLSPEELADLRDWFRKYDAEAWDRQIEEDVREEGSIGWEKRPWQPTKVGGRKKFEAFRLPRLLGLLRKASRSRSGTSRPLL